MAMYCMEVLHSTLKDPFLQHLVRHIKNLESCGQSRILRQSHSQDTPPPPSWPRKADFGARLFWETEVGTKLFQHSERLLDQKQRCQRHPTITVVTAFSSNFQIPNFNKKHMEICLQKNHGWCVGNSMHEVL